MQRQECASSTPYKYSKQAPIRGFTMDLRIPIGFADSRRFATDSRKSSTRFVPIRDGFATDLRIRTHDSHKLARIRDGYYTVLRVKCVSGLGHVTRELCVLCFFDDDALSLHHHRLN
eukprot:1958373-Prymnesium_polylepis.1